MPSPFLKWVGGKRQLLENLLAFAPKEFGAFHEPFVGGGAFFFALQRLGKLQGRGHSIADVNTELIDTYQAIVEDVEGVITLLKKHERAHNKEYYYTVRGQNPRKPVTRAARMIYLNRTGFNGLYRVNSKGKFNVPFGSYKNPRICDEENLRAVHKALACASIQNKKFESVLNRAKPGDLVYFDPPYVPLSRTANFVSYAKDGFSMADQETLARTFAELAAKGVYVMLSNSDTPEVRRMYKGFRLVQVQATRVVNSRSDRRGPVAELIILGGYKAPRQKKTRGT